MKSLADRLQRVQRDGNLSIADLARWLDREHPTVRGWVRGVKIGGAAGDQEHVEAMLALLERLVQSKHGFPVPRLSPKARIYYLGKIREMALA